MASFSPQKRQHAVEFVGIPEDIQVQSAPRHVDGVATESLEPKNADLGVARARMIIGLAGLEAARAASGEVQPEHLLLGVIRESEKWQATGKVGPHHLRAAAEAVGVTLADLESNLKRHAC